MSAERRRQVRLLTVVLLVAAGAIGGLVLQRTIGCPTGGCPITGSPWVSTIYGAVVGLFIGTGVAPSAEPPARAHDT